MGQQQWQDIKWVVVFVTNITLFVNKIPDHPIACVILPDYINNNKAMIGLQKDTKGNAAYGDNLCFFKALDSRRGVTYTPSEHFENAVRELFGNCVGGNPLSFESVQLHDLPALELKLEFNITVFMLKKKEDGSVVR